MRLNLIQWVLRVFLSLQIISTLNSGFAGTPLKGANSCLDLGTHLLMTMTHAVSDPGGFMTPEQALRHTLILSDTEGPIKLVQYQQQPDTGTDGPRMMFEKVSMAGPGQQIALNYKRDSGPKQFANLGTKEAQFLTGQRTKKIFGENTDALKVFFMAAGLYGTTQKSKFGAKVSQKISPIIAGIWRTPEIQSLKPKELIEISVESFFEFLHNKFLSGFEQRPTTNRQSIPLGSDGRFLDSEFNKVSSLLVAMHRQLKLHNFDVILYGVKRMQYHWRDGSSNVSFYAKMKADTKDKYLYDISKTVSNVPLDVFIYVMHDVLGGTSYLEYAKDKGISNLFEFLISDDAAFFNWTQSRLPEPSQEPSSI